MRELCLPRLRVPHQESAACDAARFAIIPGGGDSPLNWGPPCAQLHELGHVALAVDLRLTEPEAGWSAYVDATVCAIEAQPKLSDPLIVVGHSLAGFTVPLIPSRIRVERLVLVAGMIPRPGALAGTYWKDAGHWTHDARAQLVTLRM